MIRLDNVSAIDMNLLINVVNWSISNSMDAEWCQQTLEEAIEMHGIEATKLIKSKKPEILIIAQSAYTSEHDKNAALEAGCVSFISKPIGKDTLMNIIDEFRCHKLNS